jgi:hypothetical protein
VHDNETNDQTDDDRRQKAEHGHGNNVETAQIVQEVVARFQVARGQNGHVERTNRLVQLIRVQVGEQQVAYLVDYHGHSVIGHFAVIDYYFQFVHAVAYLRHKPAHAEQVLAYQRVEIGVVLVEHKLGY